MFFQQARDESQKQSHALPELSMLMKFNVMADALWFVGNIRQSSKALTVKVIQASGLARSLVASTDL